MAAEFPFKVVLEAVDRATAPIRRVGQLLEGVQSRAQRAFPPVGKSLAGVNRQFGVLSRRLSIVGGVAAAGAAALVKSYADAGDNIAKVSDRLGIGIEALQEYRFAAERSGVDTRTFDLAVQRLGRRVGEAAKGTGEARGALAELGISAVDAAGGVRSIESLLPEVADKLGALENANQRNALAMKLFDSEGVRLVQMLQDGSAGLDDLRREARGLGLVMSEESARAAERFTDRMSNLQGALLGVRNRIGGAVLPVLTDLSDKITSGILAKGPAIQAWASRFAERLPGRLQALRTGFASLIERLRPTIDFGRALADRFGGVQLVLGGLAAIILGPMVAALATLTASFVGLGVTLALNPIGIVVIAVGALIAKLGGLERIFGAVKRAASGAFGFITDALGIERGPARPQSSAALRSSSIAPALAPQRALSSTGKIEVKFDGAPRGTRVAVTENDGVDLRTEMGFAMQGL